MIKYLSSENLKRFAGKTCLLRVDLNVEIGMSLDSYRLEAVIPTIKLLLKNKIKVVILSHRGRPKGRDKKLSLKPFADIIARKIGRPVDFAARLGSGEGDVVLLENLRFWPGEEKNDPKFAKQIASLGDFYVNDAFAVSHRANASVAAVTKFLPSYAGLLMEREIKNLDKAMKSREHPFTVVLGGAKIHDKLGVMKYFWKKADHFLIGGAPASTFLKAAGMEVGDSLVDTASIPLIGLYLNAGKVHLPTDLKWKGAKVLDVGSKTAREYGAIIKKSKAIIWNGPMGWFETKGFSGGTKGIWKAIFANKKAKIIIGGGETVTSGRLISNFKFQISNSRNVFLSTGGGAMLDYLSGEKLPGIEALRN